MDLVDVLHAGDTEVQVLGTSGSLEAAARRLVQALRQQNVWAVLAASPQAERVLGAAMIIESRLQAGVSGPGVVVFDVNVASGTLMARTADRARRAGAMHVFGVALHSLMHPPTPQDCGLDDMLVLQEASTTCAA